jgi:hypothetical protein
MRRSTTAYAALGIARRLMREEEIGEATLEIRPAGEEA